jgi:hypothetical protein
MIFVTGIGFKRLNALYQWRLDYDMIVFALMNKVADIKAGAL